jgi:serine/alanine adding enzyme
MRSAAVEVLARDEPALHVTAMEGVDAGWDEFVSRSPEGTLCHLAGWRSIMSETLGHDCVYLAARDGEGGWHGVLPIVRLRSRLFGHHLISMAFLNDGGPIGSAAARACLVAAAVDLARRSGADELELRARQELPVGMAPGKSKVSVHLSLPDAPGVLWDRFPGKLRSQIRRSQKEGMEVRFGPREREPFYHVFSRNMRDLGTPVHSPRLFERIAAEFPSSALFGAVYHQGEPVAAGCGLMHGGELEMTWASSLREHNRLAPNMLLYWAFMEEAIQRRMRVFSFGRCTPGGGTHRFKLQWGGGDVPLPWVRWGRADGPVSSASDGPVLRFATRAWQRMPLRLANTIGPKVARQLPWF